MAFRATRKILKSLLVAEHTAGNISAPTLAAFTALKQVDPDITILVAGHGDHAATAAAAASKIKDAKAVIKVSSAEYAEGSPEDLTKLVLAVRKAGSFTTVAAGNTTWARSFIPRAAFAEDVSPIGDIIQVKDAKTFVRPVYAGNALAVVKTAQATNYLTFRATSFAAAESGGSAAVSDGQAAGPTGLQKFISRAAADTSTVDLGAAKTVIAGGRGFKNKENFALLKTLQAKIPNCAIGASRAAVDAGFCPNDLQVGQTGRVVAPPLYIAFGLSGAIQHLAGMKDSKVIACVNTDADAPIFTVSDFGLVGDLFDVIPKLVKML